jgi:hypothetical protein
VAGRRVVVSGRLCRGRRRRMPMPSGRRSPQLAPKVPNGMHALHAAARQPLLVFSSAQEGNSRAQGITPGETSGGDVRPACDCHQGINLSTVTTGENRECQRPHRARARL